MNLVSFFLHFFVVVVVVFQVGIMGGNKNETFYSVSLSMNFSCLPNLQIACDVRDGVFFSFYSLRASFLVEGHFGIFVVAICMTICTVHK